MNTDEILPEFHFEDNKGDLVNKNSIIKCINNDICISHNNTLTKYNIRKSTTLSKFTDNKPNRITAFTANPTNNTLCAGYENGTIKLFDENNNIKQFRPHSKRVTQVLYFNNYYYSTSIDGTFVKYCDVDEEVKIYYKTVKSCYGFVIYKTLVYVNCTDNIIRVYNINCEECIEIIVCDIEIYKIFVFYGDLIIFYKNGHSEIYNTKKKERRMFNAFKNVREIICKNDNMFILTKGKLLKYAVCYKDELLMHSKGSFVVDKDFFTFDITRSERVSCLDNENKEVMDYIQGLDNLNHEDNNNSVEDNTTNCIFLTMKNTVSSLDLKTLSRIDLSFHECEIFDIISCKGKIVTCSEDKFIMWRVRDNKLEKVYMHKFEFKAIGIAVYEERLIISSSDTIFFYDLKNNNVIFSAAIKSNILHTNKNFLFLGNLNELTVYEIKKNESENLINKKTREEIKLEKINSIMHNENIVCINSSHNQLFYALSFLDNNVKLYDFYAHDCRITLYGHSLPVKSLSFSPDSKTLLTCGADRLIKLWGTEFGECRRTFIGDAKNVNFITNDGFLFCDKGMKYYKKHTCIKEYKGFDLNLVLYVDKKLFVCTKYGLRYYRTGEYAIDENCIEDSEIEEEILRETKITNHRLYERFCDELEMIDTNQKTHLDDLFEILNLINLAEVDNFIYILKCEYLRIIMKCLELNYNKFPINATRIFICIGRIYAFMCKNNKDAYALFEALMERINKMRDCVGMNMFEMGIILNK